MGNYDETYEKWRKMLQNTNLYFVLFVFVLEITMYFVLKSADLIDQPLPVYLTFFLILPTLINSLILLVGNRIFYHMTPDFKFINYIPIVQMTLICMIVSSTHYVFHITLAIFCFPIFATVIFGDKKLTKHISILCFIFMGITLLYRKFTPFRFNADDYFIVEAVIAYTILIATNIICYVVIELQIEKSNVIRKSYNCLVELQEQLTRDQKTGLYGHTIFRNTLDKRVELSEKTFRPLILAIIDIDDFKKINDTYGHSKGDEVIFALVELLKQMNHAKWFLSRFGGEEFSVIFTDCDVDTAYSFLEDIRNAFEKQRYNFTDDTLTISIGMARWQSGWTAEELFNHADAAMYISKAKGKNKIEICENDGWI